MPVRLFHLFNSVYFFVASIPHCVQDTTKYGVGKTKTKEAYIMAQHFKIFTSLLGIYDFEELTRLRGGLNCVLD